MKILSEDEKVVYQQVINDVHDTWKRPLLIIQTSERVILSENPNYNFAYQDSQPNNDVAEYIVNSGVYYARIYYMKSDTDNSLLQSSSAVGSSSSQRDDSRMNNPFNMVQIKIDKEGGEFLKAAKEVILDEDSYTVLSSPRKHGLFYPEYYTFWLRRTE